MRYPEPRITTQRVGDVERVIARYETPETARLMASLQAMTTGLTFAGLATGAVWLINRQPLSSGLWLLALVGAAIAALLIARVFGDTLHGGRFGLRGQSDATLTVDLSRTAVSHSGRRYLRGGVLRFTAIPHRGGRHEERDERLKERLIPTTYREAYQVWLQHGEDFMLLADVSDERGAAAIVRRLQEVDEQMTRGHVAKNEADAFGRRSTPM